MSTGADFQLKIKALNLPNYRLFNTPNCYARITVDGGDAIATKAISGSSPEWTECFDVSLEESSTVTVQLFHISSSSKEVLRGCATIPVRDLLPPGHETTSSRHKLHQFGMKLHKQGSVVISLSRSPVQPSVSSDGTAPPIPNATQVEAAQEASQPAESPPEKKADEVRVEVLRAEETATKLKGYDGTAMDDISEAASSDLFGTVLGYVEKVVQLGDVLSKVHPFAQLAWQVLTVAHKALKGQAERDDKIKTLLITIRDMLEFVEEADATSKIGKLQETVSSMMQEIHKCAQFIQRYGEASFGSRVIRDNLMTSTDDRITQFITTFTRLKSNFDQGINIHTFNTVQQLDAKFEAVYATENDKLLENLPGWNLDGVKFDESKVCLEGTRQQLIERIHKWADSPDENCILWLSGGVGTGKTSVANSVAVFFDELRRLGACFCFNRDTAGLNVPNYLIGNLCYQLAHFKERGEFRVKPAILSALSSMGYVASSSLQTQARKLIVDTTNTAGLVGPVVVVIDALDESGTTQMRKGILAAITAELHKLPRSVKIMITSRDESDIRDSLRSCSKEVCIDDAENTPEDIASYVEHRLTRIREDSHLSQDWPGSKKFQELVTRAGGLFIWAAVACNFIEEKRDPARWLDRLLDVTSGTDGATGSPLKKLDILYTSILRNAFPDEDDPLADFRYVVGSIIVLETPLTRIELDSLLRLGDESGGDAPILQNGYEIHLSSSDKIVSPLRSILRARSTDSTGKDGPLRLLHPSLYEFLTSRADGHFRINPLEQNHILALRCLRIMNTQLKIDICEIRNPSLFNKEIEDLPERLVRYISDGLRYSCRSIGHHITKVQCPDTPLIDALNEFLTVHLLHWTEVMSLLGEVSRADDVLQTLAKWIKEHTNNDSDLRALVADAIPFLKHSGDAVRLSALHTYYSTLPLAPKVTTLFRRFIDDVPHAPCIISSHPTWPITPVRVMGDHTDCVRHVAFSPDGKKLASASYDETVRLWDVESGQAIGAALNGHTAPVLHVVFSPDGRKLASASYDATVRLWIVDGGKAMGQALTGHTDIVKTVEFSPDGKQLVSGSYDHTLRLWDVQGGKAVGEALQGHNGMILHVAISPGGKYLASASYDCTVRLWDAKRGKAIEPVLQGHYSPVNHVTFSPDGKKLASASSDMTIRLWGVKSCEAIRTLEGHTKAIWYVVFSPHGRTLASASDDATVRLWDVESGKSVGPALEGHTSWVNSVVFSPDGKKLATASYDHTVRLWDVEHSRAIGEALQGHTDLVLHAAFSTDGNTVASASSDSTVRLWDVESGKAIEEALRRHNSPVNHVVFSPDGTMLASASYDETVRFWDVESGQVIGKALKGHVGSVFHVAFSPDGNKLATASDDETVRIWDVQKGKAIGPPLQGHIGWVNNVIFSPDGKTLGSTSYDRTVRLWDVESCVAIGQALKGHTGLVLHAVFSPDGRKLASASDDGTVRLWDVESSKTIEDALIDHGSSVNYVAFSPDGQKLVSLSCEGTVKVWDLEGHGITTPALESHIGLVLHVEFSRDGKKLVSASDDGTAQLWDVESGKAIGAPFEPHAHQDRVRPQILDIPGDLRLWLTECFTTSEDCGSGDEMTLKSDPVDKMVQVAMSIDQVGFLRCGTKKLLWLPAMLRGSIFAVRSSSIVVGGNSGAITIIRYIV